MEEWYTAQEIIGLPGLPSTDRRIRARAEKEGWQSRQREFGKGLEYHVTALPTDAQLAPELALHVGQRVRVLYDPDGDLGRVYAFDDKGGFIAVAECPELTGLDRKEIAARAKAMQRQHINDGMKALRQEAKDIGAKAAAADILDAREEDAGKVLLFPKPEREHASAGLAGAEQAIDAERPKAAEVVSQAAMDKLRAEQAEAELRAAAEADEPDFDSPYGRARWIFERVFYGKWALTQVPERHREFLRRYYKTDAGRGVNLDRYLSDFHPRFGEVKAYLLREEIAEADGTEQAAG